MSLIDTGTVNNIFYCSEEHRNETLLELSYEDKGEMVLDERGITFKGKKLSLKMNNIQKIALVPNLSRELGGWIRVWYKDENGNERVGNLIKLDDDVLMGKKKENTSDLYEEIIEFQKKWRP